MIEITLLGTGSPLVDPHRAGPATLVRAGGATLLFDCGRGVLMRAAAVGGHGQPADGARAHPPPQRPHHRPQRRDHQPLGHDLRARPAARSSGRRARRPSSTGCSPRWPRTSPTAWPTTTTSPGIRGVEVAEHLDGRRVRRGRRADRRGAHRPPARAPERRLSRRARGRRGRDRGRHRAVRGPRLALRRRRRARAHRHPRRPGRQRSRCPRLQDILDYHCRWSRRPRPPSRSGVGTLVLTHYVPPMQPGAEEEWRDLAAAHFDGPIELGDDLHRGAVVAP